MSLNNAAPILADFKPVQLSNPHSQTDLLNYFAWVIAAQRCKTRGAQTVEKANDIYQETLKAVWRFGVPPDFVKQRQLTTLPKDIGPSNGEPQLPLHFSITNPSENDLRHKMLTHRQLSRQVFEAAYADAGAVPTTLIHVTCAGYVSPSAAQEFVSERGWQHTGVTHSYHMGCYGAFPPVKMAGGFLANRGINLGGGTERRIDIVHTEVLSVHGDYTTLDPGSLVTLTLFADGFIKYSMFDADSLEGRPGLQVLSQYETLIPNSQQEMTWIPNGQLFEMYLSKAVPMLIKQNIREFVRELCRRAGIDFESARDQLFYAIHPGGPKIVEHIKDELQIVDAQMHWSREVLREHGNMSSATVPHIWARMLEELPVGAVIVSMAFGPGLTATGLVLRKV